MRCGFEPLGGSYSIWGCDLIFILYIYLGLEIMEKNILEVGWIFYLFKYPDKTMPCFIIENSMDFFFLVLVLP